MHITVTSLHYVRHLIEPTSIVEAVNRRLFFQPAPSTSKCNVKSYNPLSTNISSGITQNGGIRRGCAPFANRGHVRKRGLSELSDLSGLWKLSGSRAPNRSHLVLTAVVDGCSADATSGADCATFPAHIAVIPRSSKPPLCPCSTCTRQHRAAGARRPTPRRARHALTRSSVGAEQDFDSTSILCD